MKFTNRFNEYLYVYTNLKLRIHEGIFEDDIGYINFAIMQTYQDWTHTCRNVNGRGSLVPNEHLPKYNRDEYNLFGIVI